MEFRGTFTWTNTDATKSLLNTNESNIFFLVNIIISYWNFRFHLWKWKKFFILKKILSWNYESMGISFYFLFSFIFSFFMIKFYNFFIVIFFLFFSLFIAIFQIWFNLLYNFINLLSFLVIFHLTSSLCFRMIIFELDNFTFLKISFFRIVYMTKLKSQLTFETKGNW